MSSTSSAAWPAPDGEVGRPEDIRWKTVKTEEEEYLDKLQSKLARAMIDGFQTSRRETNDRLDPDELPDARVTIPHDDEGLHLMYECPPVADGDSEVANPFRQPFPSTSQPLKIEVTPDMVDYEVDLSPTSRRRMVRFRSRVRITSGVHSAPSATSSTGSVSSSISVPLRGTHEATVSIGTASLSDMLPSEAANAWLSGTFSSTRKAAHERRERRRNSTSPHSPNVDERTPLTSSNYTGRRRSYTEQPDVEIDEDADAELDRIRTAARKSEEQVMFGKWPWRLLNRHWWWWKLEPLVCCCSRFDDEFDAE